jgi:acyl-CoA thioester hydrolase
VIASLKLDFSKEIRWPGRVDTGTGVLKIGNSSIRLFQKLFQDGQSVATAETVIVQVDDQTGRGKRLSDDARETLGGWLLSDVGQ